MPRIPRMYFKTEYFHVIAQGTNKSYIFDDSVDIKHYIKNIESKGLEYDYVFMDVMENSDEVCAMVVKKILKENNCNMEQFKKDKKNLQRLIVTLKRDYNISLRDIAINLNINRESVRKIYNKK